MMRLLNCTKKRFWKKVVKTDTCWHWQGCSSGNNRGSFLIEGRRYVPTEVMLAIYGQFRVEGLLILHTCDNGFWVNPDHLYWGTQVDNMKDRSERHPGWKWAEGKAEALRIRRKEARYAALRLPV